MSDSPPEKRPPFSGGTNIALKMPPHLFEASVAFYRDILGLEELPPDGPGSRFALGPVTLWVDRCPGMSQAEVWLEVRTEDTAGAAAWLATHGVPRRDEIEPLPEGLDGFWIAAPGDLIHLVCQGGGDGKSVP